MTFAVLYVQLECWGLLYDINCLHVMLFLLRVYVNHTTKLCHLYQEWCSRLTSALRTDLRACRPTVPQKWGWVELGPNH